MSWDEYCETNASAPDGNGWLLLVAVAAAVAGVIVLIVVL